MSEWPSTLKTKTQKRAYALYSAHPPEQYHPQSYTGDRNLISRNSLTGGWVPNEDRRKEHYKKLCMRRGLCRIIPYRSIWSLIFAVHSVCFWMCVCVCESVLRAFGIYIMWVCSHSCMSHQPPHQATLGADNTMHGWSHSSYLKLTMHFCHLGE